MNDNDRIVRDLQSIFTDGFAEPSDASLRCARGHAEVELNPALLHALPWPKGIEEHCVYLRGFTR